MWAERFVQGLKYDAGPRTTVPIEQFNREAYASFDTMHGAESQYANCTERVVITLKALQPARRRSCRIKTDD